MLKQILINAKVQAEQERNNEIANLTRRLQAEKIAPFYAEIEKKKAEAIAKEREAYNQQIVALQNAFEERKKEYETATEEKKSRFSEQVITTETAHINAKYSNVISSIEKMIAENGE